MDKRTQRALDRDPEVIQVSEVLFLVESSGRGDQEYYQVGFDDWSCECPDYQKRGMKCYHIRAAILKVASGDALPA